MGRGALDRPCYGVYQTCPDVVVFGSHGPAFVFTGYEAEYRVCDAGALRAEPLVPLYLARSKQFSKQREEKKVCVHIAFVVFRI